MNCGIVKGIESKHKQGILARGTMGGSLYKWKLVVRSDTKGKREDKNCTDTWQCNRKVVELKMQ